MVLALENSNGLLALKDDIAAKWMRSYREGKPLPEEKLDWFPALFDKIKSDLMLFLVVSKKYIQNQTNNSSFKSQTNLGMLSSTSCPAGGFLTSLAYPAF